RTRPEATAGPRAAGKRRGHRFRGVCSPSARRAGVLGSSLVEDAIKSDGGVSEAGQGADCKQVQDRYRLGPEQVVEDRYVQAGELGAAAGQAVEQEAADVGVDAAAFLGGGDHGGQVVVSENQIGSLTGDLGAAHSHGNSDVGAAQGGAVVDAVAGHGHHVAGV